MNTFRRSRVSAPVVMVLVAGFVAVSILHLLLTILTSQSVYELADLKKEKLELDTTSQILSEEVSSLASNQNLLNTASRLGMVPNTNPVFLRLTDQAVLGHPLPAPIASAQSMNLVANSAMIIESTQLDQLTSPASTIEPAEIPVSPVASTSLIPASPTR